MKNSKIMLLALVYIALVCSLILPASVMEASETVSLPDDHSIQGQVTPMVSMGAEPEYAIWILGEAALQYTLTIGSTGGGSVTTPGEGTFVYNEGTVVDLVVKAETDYKFVRWAGDIGTLECQCHSTTITMNGNYTIMANFEKLPPLPPNTCFIATAAYGTPMAEEIQILREFRDEYLLSNTLGRALVNIYYNVSPSIAEFIIEHPRLKPIVKVGLLPVVAMSTAVVNTTPAEKMAITSLLVLVAVIVTIWATKWRGRGPDYI